MNHHRALPHREVADALATVDGSGSSLTAKLAFRFLVLTAARGGEVRGATWAEIDHETIGSGVFRQARMKAGAEHRVPAVRRCARRAGEGPPVVATSPGLVFPAPSRARKATLAT